VTFVVALGAGGPRSHVADWSARLLAEAQRRDIQVAIVDRPENLVSVPADHPSVHSLVAADFADVAAVRSAVPALAHASAVIGFREYSLLPTAQLALEYGLPWNSVESVRTCRRKDLCRELLRANGFTQPTVQRFSDQATAADYLRAAELPLIVKPQDAFGSQGVCLVRTPAEIPPCGGRSLAL
jgi:glutathione synthase/RimK-type ligase-like ATP-grasp enzyme